MGDGVVEIGGVAGDGNVLGDGGVLGDGRVVVDCDVVVDADTFAGGNGREVSCGSGSRVSVFRRLLGPMMPSHTRLSDIVPFEPQATVSRTMRVNWSRWRLEVSAEAKGSTVASEGSLQVTSYLKTAFTYLAEVCRQD